MARLANLRTTPLKNLPLKDRFNEAIRWLENEGKGESIRVAAYACSITEHL